MSSQNAVDLRSRYDNPSRKSNRRRVKKSRKKELSSKPSGGFDADGKKKTNASQAVLDWIVGLRPEKNYV